MLKNLILIFISFSASVFSQPESKYGVPTYFCNWDNIRLDENYQALPSDTCFFVVSTRHYDKTKKEFLDYEYDTTATLKYFAIYFKQNNWMAVPYSSLDKMLNTKIAFKDFVIFTEGLGKTFNKGIDRATKLIRTYTIDELFFDWPTERPYLKEGKNIKVTRQVSEKVAIPYAKFLEDFQNYKNNHPEKFKTLTLLFHSMGNLILMHDLKQNLFKNIKQKFADNVLLNAPCVNQKNHAQWLNTLTISKEIFITINNRDRNLNGAKLIFRAHQLGETAKQPYCKNVHYVNFSKVLEKEHNYFLMQPLLTQKPYLKKFYEDIFKGSLPQLKF